MLYLTYTISWNMNGREASTSPHIILNKWFQLNKQEAAVYIEW